MNDSVLRRLLELLFQHHILGRTEALDLLRELDSQTRLTADLDRKGVEL